MAKINELFKPLYTSKKRYFLITGGRGSLKTTTVQDWVVRLMLQSGHGILYTRYTMASAELSIIPEFEATIQRLGVADKFRRRKNRIWHKKTKSFIEFSGIKTSTGDQTAKLKSISGITTWIVEEGEEFTNEDAFNKIDDSIRTTTRQNRIVWIQNPTTKDHFMYKKFIKDTNKKINVEGWEVTVSDHDDVEHIHTSYHIAERLGYLSDSWLEKAKVSYQKAMEDEAIKPGARYESHYYYNYIGGWLEKAFGVIIKDWTYGEFDRSVPFVYGLDYGYNPDPLALIKVGFDRRRKKMYLKGLVYETEVDDDDLVLYMDAYIDNKKNLVVCDINEPKTTKKLRTKYKYNTTKAKKLSHKFLQQEVRELNTYDIIVDKSGPKTGDLVMELNNWAWNDKKAGIPKDEYDHFMNAMVYAYRRLHRGRRKGVSVR